MKIKGIYEADKPIPGYIEIDGVYLSPRKSQKAYNHSPDGFNWGYGGSGPSQLALAILLEATDKDTAMRYYQDFKWEIISKLPQGTNFEIDIDIDKWLREKGVSTE